MFEKKDTAVESKKRPESNELKHLNDSAKKLFEKLNIETTGLLKSERLNENFADEARFEKEVGEGVTQPELWNYKGETNFILKRKSKEDQLTTNETKIQNQYKHEYLSWIMDNLAGTNVVPFTSMVETPDTQENASVQAMIPDATPAIALDLENPENLSQSQRESLANIFVLDFLTFNQDREGQNFIEKDGKIYAIDNGVTFGENPPQHLAARVLRKMEGTPIQKDTLEKIKNLYTAIQTNESFRANFETMLAASIDDEARAQRLMPLIAERLEKLVEQKAIPPYDDFVFTQEQLFEMAMSGNY